MKRTFNPPQETWVMREMGAAFDPEKVCQYTGLALHQFPAHTERGLMGYWRTDGFLCAVRSMTPEEAAWIVANPERFEADRQAFQGWLDKLAKARQS